MKRRQTGGPDRQIYLQSDKNCLVPGPTLRREVAVWVDLSIEKHSVSIDQSKSRIEKLCTGNQCTIYCTVMDAGTSTSVKGICDL